MDIVIAEFLDSSEKDKHSPVNTVTTESLDSPETEKIMCRQVFSFTNMCDFHVCAAAVLLFVWCCLLGIPIMVLLIISFKSGSCKDS